MNETTSFGSSYAEQVLESVREAIFVVDKELRITVWNLAAARLFSIARKQALGKKLFDLLPELVPQCFPQLLSDALLGKGEGARLEIQQEEQRAESRCISLRVDPLLDERGEVRGAIAIFEDVTAWKRAELDTLRKVATANARLLEESRREAAKLRVLNRINLSVISKPSFSAILKEIADTACELVDARCGTISLTVGEKGQQWVAACSQTSPDPGSADSLIGQELCEKLLAQHALRQAKDILVVPLLDRKGDSLGLFVLGSKKGGECFSAEDEELLTALARQAAIVIEHARLFVEADQKAKDLKLLLDTIASAFSSLELDQLLATVAEQVTRLGMMTYCRIALLDETGEKLTVRGEHAARDSGWERVVGQSYSLSEAPCHRRAIETREPVAIGGNGLPSEMSSWERQVVLPDGTGAALLLPMVVKDQVLGVIVLGETRLYRWSPFSLAKVELWRAVASYVAIAVANARLYEVSQRAYRDLETAQEQLVRAEKLRALGEMASGVAHDFNNILAVILGRTELLLETLPTGASPGLRQSLAVIHRAALDGATAVRRVYGFTRKGGDEGFVRLDVNAIVKEVAEATRGCWKDQAQQKGIFIELKTELGQALPVAGNAAELREVLTNMVFNSVEAMPQGGKITLKTGMAGDYVVISVTDTGIGMSEEVRRRVFDPFFTTKGPQGSGLGLSIAYGVVTRHKGEIAVESKEGEGTTFAIRLPSAPEAPKEVPVASHGAAKEAARILVIDDEPALCDILKLMLQRDGHDITICGGGEEGIAAFQESDFDIVFTDLGMPETSGWEVARAVKAAKPAVPVVLVTGWGMSLDPQEVKGRGVGLVISKPFRLQEVRDLVTKAMELREGIR